MERERRLQMQGEADDVAFFELMDSHLPRAFSAVMRRLPSEPRCRLCHAPYGGVGGRIMRRFGFGPSRKNPALSVATVKTHVSHILTKLGLSSRVEVAGWVADQS